MRSQERTGSECENVIGPNCWGWAKRLVSLSNEDQGKNVCHMQQGNSNLIRFVRWPKSSLATTALSSSELSFIEKIHSSMRKKIVQLNFRCWATFLPWSFFPRPKFPGPIFSLNHISQSNFQWSIFSLDCFSDFVLVCPVQNPN